MSRCPFGGAGFFMFIFNDFSTCVDVGLLAARVDVLVDGTVFAGVGLIIAIVF